MEREVAIDTVDGQNYATPRLFDRLLSTFRPTWDSRGVRMAIFELGVFSTVR